MAGLEELKKKLEPLFDSETGPSIGLSLDPCGSYMVSDDGTVNLLSRSYGVYNINELGLQKCPAMIEGESEIDEKTYCCASHEMHVFGTIGCGASSVVQRAIRVPIHRILALKKINVFEKRQNNKEVAFKSNPPLTSPLLLIDAPTEFDLSIALRKCSL